MGTVWGRRLLVFSFIDVDKTDSLHPFSPITKRWNRNLQRHPYTLTYLHVLHTLKCWPMAGHISSPYAKRRAMADPIYFHFSKIFWTLLGCPWGSCTLFSNSPCPVTCPHIFSDISEKNPTLKKYQGKSRKPKLAYGWPLTTQTVRYSLQVCVKIARHLKLISFAQGCGCAIILSSV